MNMMKLATEEESKTNTSSRHDESKNREIEVRFLDIDQNALIEKLRSLNARDLGEDFLSEVIFYDKAGRWQYKEKKFVRIRQTKTGVFLAFKHNEEDTATGTKEIEVEVGDFEKTKALLEEIGLAAFRENEKKRRTFLLGDVTVDIDTWPSVPTYVELEGPSEKSLKAAAKKLGLDWSKTVFESPRFVIEKYYKIPVSRLRFFTFQKIE